MYYIYGLFDPRNGQLHYIGRTSNMERRLKQHCRADSNVRKIEWISELNSTWLEPMMQELDSTEILNDVIEMEKFYVNYFRMLGAYLFNGPVAGISGPVDPTKKKSLPLYLPPVLEAEIQADADADFITRNQWITDACKFYLKFKRDQAS
jgi:hypothetical protein